MKKKTVKSMAKAKPIELQAKNAAPPPPNPRSKSKQTRHGPEPERLKIEGNWIGAVDKALTVKRPAKGWPK